MPKKVTPSQFIEGLLFLGHKHSEFLFQRMIKMTDDKSMSSEMKNEYEWEVFYFTFASIYLMLISVPAYKKTDITEKYMELYSAMMAKAFSPAIARLSYDELVKRIELYKKAWKIEGGLIMACSKLLLNLLFMIMTKSDLSDYIKGYITYAESSNEHIRQHYMRSWFPTAKGLECVLESLHSLSGHINGTLEEFEIVFKLE